MGRKIRIKKSTPVSSTSTSTDTNIDIENKEWLIQGKPVSIGTELLVLHYSSSKWVNAFLKEVKESSNGSYIFYFYIPNPGWIALHEDRVKHIHKKKIKITKGESK